MMDAECRRLEVVRSGRKAKDPVDRFPRYISVN
jgi:hypothetical protein